MIDPLQYLIHFFLALLKKSKHTLVIGYICYLQYLRPKEMKSSLTKFCNNGNAKLFKGQNHWLLGNWFSCHSTGWTYFCGQDLFTCYSIQQMFLIQLLTPQNTLFKPQWQLHNFLLRPQGHQFSRDINMLQWLFHLQVWKMIRYHGWTMFNQFT
jgi:hypothetical protein